MVEEPEAERLDEHLEDEGGPVKSFLEHLEDLRWVLIKSLVALGLGVLICLIGGNYVVAILKRPLEKAPVRYPKHTIALAMMIGTNRMGTFILSADDTRALNLGTNTFAAMRLEPALDGTNQVLHWRLDNDPELAEQ